LCLVALVLIETCWRFIKLYLRVVFNRDGIILNVDNKQQIDLQKNANKTYFMLQKFFEIKIYLKKLKLRLKTTIIFKTLTYASETWILTKRDKKQINVFERKGYRKILSPVYDNKKKIGEY
jgi:hypothetical protein